MALVFWWFEYRHWQSFSTSKVTFDGAVLHELFNQLEVEDNLENKITVVHFMDEQCPCSSYSRSHITNLQGVLAHSRQIIFRHNEHSFKNIVIPATPAVAVWDENGDLAYFGPYSSGALCGQGADFITKVMAELEKRKNPKWINMLGIGCYCPWKKQENFNA